MTEHSALLLLPTDIFLLMARRSVMPSEAYLTAGGCRGNNPWERERLVIYKYI